MQDEEDKSRTPVDCGIGTLVRMYAVADQPTSDSYSTTTQSTTATTTELATAETTTAPLPTQYCITDVPHILQTDAYPTACESIAAVALMAYYGVMIDVDTFLQEHLPIASYPEQRKDGLLYGEDPNAYFIGDPYAANGYGCYGGAIVKAMQSALGDTAEVALIEGLTLETLCQTYIVNDEPVIIWATIDMEEPMEGNQWILPDGTAFTFIRPEHAVVLVGMDETQYYVCDSLAENAVIGYPKTDCERAYAALGMQAVHMRWGEN